MDKKSQLYLECNTGISGDMTVAALLDLGADEQTLRAALASLPLDGFEIRISRVKKSGLDACDFSVILDHEYENHDHDMEYLHGEDHHHKEGHHHGEDHDHEEDHHHGEEHHHGEDHDHEEAHHHGEEHHHEEGHHHGEDYHHEEDHHHGEGHHHGVGHHHEEDHHHGADFHHDHGTMPEHHHSHEETHSHGHSHHHVHRGMREVREIIGQSMISEHAKETALRIFEILGEAEAKAHGETLETVHFHEVGAVDSIVDIVAAAVCLDNLGIDEVIVPFLCEGGGTIRCAHGILPVPVPAVSNIVAAYGLKLRLTGEQAEYVTPTGAAIAAAVRTSDRLPEEFTVKRIGLGAGKRNYQRPGLLRAMLIQDTSCSSGQEDVIWKLESNIDDANGENFGYVMERLLEAGARDVFYVPIYMKKNRPAYMLSVICLEQDIPAMEDVMFRETTTIGIRRSRMERTILKRRSETVQTPLGEAQVKICELPREQRKGSEGRNAAPEIRCYPEYESVTRLCREHGRPYREIYDMICRACQGRTEDGGCVS